MMICGQLLGTVGEVLLLLATHANLDLVNVYAPKDVVIVTIKNFDSEWEIHRIVGPEWVQLRKKDPRN